MPLQSDYGVMIRFMAFLEDRLEPYAPVLLRQLPRVDEAAVDSGVATRPTHLMLERHRTN